MGTCHGTRQSSRLCLKRHAPLSTREPLFMVDWTRLVQLDPEHWPKPPQSRSNHTQSKADELCIPVHVTVTQVEPMIPLDRFSSFSKFIRVTAWIIRFVSNCQAHCKETPHSSHCLSVAELKGAERYWISFIQKDIFQPETSR